VLNNIRTVKLYVCPLLLQYGYRMSKTEVNMAGKLLAEDLAAQNIPVGIVHPGTVSALFIGSISRLLTSPMVTQQQNVLYSTNNPMLTPQKAHALRHVWYACSHFCQQWRDSWACC
jgi:NAD(P)-dependent dehydrogenase (short-subunit alcohol dehydrogenase family)